MRLIRTVHLNSTVVTTEGCNFLKKLLQQDNLNSTVVTTEVYLLLALAHLLYNLNSTVVTTEVYHSYCSGSADKNKHFCRTATFKYSVEIIML